MSVSLRVRELFRCDKHSNPLVWQDYCCTVKERVVELKFEGTAGATYVHRPDFSVETNLTYSQLISLGEGVYDLEFLKAISSDN